MSLQTYIVTLDDGNEVEVDVETSEAAQPDFRTEVKASDGTVDGPGSLRSFVTGADGGPSMLGFAQNVLASGMDFAKNVAAPLMHPAETARGLAAAVREPTLTGQLIRDAAIKRYGSVDAFLNTLYTDPVGAASDASLLAGGAATAARAAGATRGAAHLGQVSAALNPMAIPAELAGQGGRALYGAALNPSRRIRRGFPGAVDEGYARNVLPTEGGLNRAEAALEQSAAHTDDLLQTAQAAGAPGVNVRTQIAPSLAEPMQEARRIARVSGVTDETGEIASRARGMVARNQSPVPLDEANKLKRTAQTLADNAFRARERGALIKDVDALANEKVAQAYRRAIEANALSVGVEGIAESNRKTQSLIGLAQALEDATQQPSRLTHLMSTLGAVGGGLAGGLPSGAAAYVAGRLATAKPIMAGAGLAMGKSGKTLRNAQIVRALSVLAAASSDGEGAPEQQ